MREDPALAAFLGDQGGVTHDGVEHEVGIADDLAEAKNDAIADLGGGQSDGPGEHTEHIEVGVLGHADLVDRAGGVGKALAAGSVHAGRNHQIVGGGQDHSPQRHLARRRVDDDQVELVGDRRERLVEPAGRHLVVADGDAHLVELGPARNHLQPLSARRDRNERFPVENRVAQSHAVVGLVAEVERRAALGVSVHEEY